MEVLLSTDAESFPDDAVDIPVQALLRGTDTEDTDLFMNYLKSCADTLRNLQELQDQASNILKAQERLLRIVTRFEIPTEAMYLPKQYQFQIASLALSLSHMITDDQEHHWDNPHVQAIQKLLQAASDHEIINEDIDHLVVAITVIDGFPKNVQRTFASERQEFVDLYINTRDIPKDRRAAVDKADAWLKNIASLYAEDKILRLSYKTRGAYNRAYKKISRDLGFTVAESNASYASGMGLTSLQLVILCIRELETIELVSHELEHLDRNLSLFGLFGDALEEGLIELESLRKLREYAQITDIDVDLCDAKEYYTQEMKMLQMVYGIDIHLYGLLNQMSYERASVTDAQAFMSQCMSTFGLEGPALLYLAGVVPLDGKKEKEDLSAFSGREFGKIPSEEVAMRLYDVAHPQPVVQ
jgi:hypothetical protein